MIAGVALVVASGVLPFLPSALAVGGEHQWLDQFSASASPAASTDSAEVALDSVGNVFAAGAGTSGAGFLVKYDSGGHKVWTKVIDAPSHTHLATDPAGSIVVVHSTATGQGASVAKYDTNGNLSWTTPITTTGYPEGVAISAANGSSGAIYVSGYDAGAAFLRRYDTTGTMVWTTPLSDGSGPVAVDGFGAVYLKTGSALHKVDLSGADLWVPRPLPPAPDQTASGGFAVDAAGDVYIAGSIADPPPPNQVQSGRTDVLLRKYDRDFILVWARQFGTPADEFPGKVAVGANGISVTGQTTGVFPGQTFAGGRDAFVRRFDTNGLDLWTFEFGTPGYEDVPSAAASSGGSVLVGGTTDGSFPGHVLTTQREAYVSRIEPLGPLASGILLTRNPVGVGESVNLTATISDFSTGGAAVTSAAYTVDGGTPRPMQAGPGAFGGPVVSVRATIPAFARAGRHSVCVRGTDAATNTGPGACATLQVSATPPPPPPADTAGPSTTGVVVTPNPSIAGHAVVLQAVVDDQATGGAPVAAASYRLDAGPPVSMAATDGAFGQPLEAVTATADIGTPNIGTQGAHSLCVSGIDAVGNTGAEQCASLTVQPAPLPQPTLVLGETLSLPGYWMLGADGRVFSFGVALPLGQPAGSLGSAQAVDIESTPSGLGYWIVDDAGHVHAYGDAPGLGGISLLPAGERAISLSGTPSGRGYWVFTTAGRAFSFGDATFFGDMSSVRLNGNVLNSVATPSGLGYYMVASDGGVFSFGDAKFWGSMGATKLNAPVKSLVADSDGAGYWLVASDGGVFAFNAPFNGSMGAVPLNQPITGMVRFGNGYLMVAGDGGIFNFSLLPFAGSLGANPPPRPIVSVAVLGG